MHPQRLAAEPLVRAHEAPGAHGYGLVIYDAYRPWYVTKMFWDATPMGKKYFVPNGSSTRGSMSWTQRSDRRWLR